MRLRLFAIVACVGVWQLGFGSLCRADGLVRDGVGPISTGRGATNLGFADNAAIIMDNPGAMSNVADGGLVEGGVDTLITNIHYTDPQNDLMAVVRGCPGPMVGYVQHIDDTPWSVGLGAFVPAGFGSEFHMVNPITGPSMYRSLGLFGKLLPAVSYRWSDRLSIGANLGLALGHTALEGPFFIQSGPFAGVPTLLNLHTTGAAITGGLGLQYILTDRTTLGVAYTEQTQFDADGNARATILTPFGPLASGFDARTRLTWPRSLGVGLKHEMCCCQRMGLDVIWYNWSKAFDQFDITLSNPSNPIVGGLLGPSYTDVFPMRWHDTVSLRLGYEWDANDTWTWRGGYVYHPSPAPNSTLNPYTDGVLLHTFSAGCSYRACRGVWNFAYQYMFAPTRSVGTSSVVGGDFSNSTYNAQAHWVNISYLIPF
jgi:long-chain fatty acid transport protein